MGKSVATGQIPHLPHSSFASVDVEKSNVGIQ
jgi:hypothetical protein